MSLKLLDKSSYNVGDFTVEVIGLNVDQLNKIYGICSAMDRKIKAKILEAAADEDLSRAIAKSQNKETLTTSELLKLSQFGQDSSSAEFTLQECLDLFTGYQECILKVTDSTDKVCTADFKAAVLDSPKYLKLLSNLIYQEYKSATEVSELKKK